MSERETLSENSIRSKKTSKTESTIISLSQLLKATPAAEELIHTWSRSHSETLQHDGPRLQDLKRALDAGKVIDRGEGSARGIPMWIVVRMCKATWHQDGTWPLIGVDEETTSVMQMTATVRSIHPSAQLLRPKGVHHFQVPAETEEAEQSQVKRAEPSAEDIAASYRRRGLYVEEAEQYEDDW